MLTSSTSDFFLKILPYFLKLFSMNFEVESLIPSSRETSVSLEPSLRTRLMSSFRVYVKSGTVPGNKWCCIFWCGAFHVHTTRQNSCSRRTSMPFYTIKLYCTPAKPRYLNPTAEFQFDSCETLDPIKYFRLLMSFSPLCQLL